MEPKDRLIFALDVASREEALNLVELLHNDVGLFKVGWELFMAAGPQFLLDLVGNYDHSRIFLDLKIYDILNTLKGALKNIVSGVALVTIHSDLPAGGLTAILKEIDGGFKVLAVTLLTSLSGKNLRGLGYAAEYAEDPSRLVLLRAKSAQAAGCHGVVCSGQEAGKVKEACGQDFLVVCPGIRPSWSAVRGDDQERVVTPFEAMKNGADFIVVGRPIRIAIDPVAAARQVAEEMTAGLAARGK
ncbi:MAG: orotidine-5'-phosphate decarboxylase, partial [Syntrophobacterales bacterium]